MQNRTTLQLASEAPSTGAAQRGARKGEQSAADLHLVRGRTMRAALIQARGTFGAKALVVDQLADLDPETGAGRVTLAVSTSIPRSAEALRTLRGEAARLLAAASEPREDPAEPESHGVEGAFAGPVSALTAEPIVDGAATRRPVVTAPTAPGGGVSRSILADVERRLREHGASKKLRERVLEGIVSSGDADSHPLDLAAVEIGRAFGVATLPLAAGETAIVALLGQTGVGKTTTLAKLAARLVRAGRRVALATLDHERIGAGAQLAAFARSVGVQALAMGDPERFAESINSGAAARFDVILVDGSGDLAADAGAIEALRAAILPNTVRVSALITIAASSSQATLDAVTRALMHLEPVGVVITKLDESTEPLPAFEHAAARSLGVAFLTNGPDIGRHFVRAGAERFADVALIGRLA